MGLCLNVLIIGFATIASLTVITVAALCAKSFMETDDAAVLGITTAIATFTWIGTMFYFSEKFITTVETFCYKKKQDNKKSSEKGDKNDESQESGGPHDEGTDGCCKLSCCRKKYRISLKSKWPSFIYMLFLLTALILCLCRFFYDLSNNTFKTTHGVSGTTINVYGFGTALVNGDSNKTALWNAADIANPEVENLVSFISTKRVTVRQTPGNCSESKKTRGAACETHIDCPEGKIFELGNGISTGNCLNGTCEVHGWCPVEPAEREDEVTIEELDGVGAYFLHVINHLSFNVEGEEVRHDNTVEDMSCTHNKQNPDCPMLPVEYIVRTAMNVTEELSKFPEGGTTISIKLRYKCSYEENHCKIDYNFKQLYTVPAHLADYDYSIIANPSGSTDSRIYIKATGILFLVEVDASMEYRSNAKLINSASAAFVFVQSVEPLARMTTWFFSMTIGFACFFSCCCHEKVCCVDKASSSSNKPTANSIPLNGLASGSLPPNSPTENLSQP